MSNPYFNATGVPQAETRGSSSSIRTEFLAVQAGFEGINTALLARGRIAGQAWTGTHNFTGGTITVPTLTYGASGANAASIDYVNNASFQTAFPGQVLGFLRSTGTVASFGTSFAGFAANEVKGADIASAATINLTTATGNFVHVTGTATISAITIPIGAERTVIFDGALTLTNSALLALPGGTNIATAANDRMVVRGDTAGANVISYIRADGRPVSPSGVELLGQATVGSAVANIDFLNIFSAAYDRYVIELQGIAPSATDKPLLRFAQAGAVVTATSYSNPAPDGGAAAGATSMDLLPSTMVIGAANALNATLDVRNANGTTALKGLGVRGSTSSIFVVREGYYNGTTAISGFRLYWLSGANFTAGTVRVYGIKNS